MFYVVIPRCSPGAAPRRARPARPAISPSCCAPAWRHCGCRRNRRSPFARNRRRCGGPATRFPACVSCSACCRRQPAGGVPAATWRRGTGQGVARPRGALQHADRRPGAGTGWRTGTGAGRGVDARAGPTPRSRSRRPPGVSCRRGNYPRASTSSRSCGEDAGRGRAGPVPRTPADDAADANCAINMDRMNRSAPFR